MTNAPRSARGLTVEIRHTAELARAELALARELLDTAFCGSFGESDWEHALGGLHVLAWDGAQLVGHAALVQRRLLYEGRALCTGYVEGVAVLPARQRQGIGMLVTHEVMRLVRAAYEVGALSCTEASSSLYLRQGWSKFRGRTFALTRTGVMRTPDEDEGVYVLPVTTQLDLRGDLTCDYRDGDAW